MNKKLLNTKYITEIINTIGKKLPSQLLFNLDEDETAEINKRKSSYVRFGRSGNQMIKNL